MAGYTSDELKLYYHDMMLVVEPPFVGRNYVSLYWGDEDGEPVARPSLTPEEYQDFLEGFYEAFKM